MADGNTFAGAATEWRVAVPRHMGAPGRAWLEGPDLVDPAWCEGLHNPRAAHLLAHAASAAWATGSGTVDVDVAGLARRYGWGDPTQARRIARAALNLLEGKGLVTSWHIEDRDDGAHAVVRLAPAALAPYRA